MQAVVLITLLYGLVISVCDFIDLEDTYKIKRAVTFFFQSRSEMVSQSFFFFLQIIILDNLFVRSMLK